MSSKRGATILEIAVTLMLTAVVGMGVLIVMSSGTQAMRITTTSSYTKTSAHVTLEKIADRLVGADLGSMFPSDVTAPAWTSSLDYQRVIGFEAGVMIWSSPERLCIQPSPTDPDDNLDNDGNGLVDEHQVVWIENPGLADERVVVLGSWVRDSLSGEVEGNGLDDNGNGLIDEPGLCFDFDGRRLNVSLSVERAPTGLEHATTSTVQRVVALNTFEL